MSSYPPPPPPPPNDPNRPGYSPHAQSSTDYYRAVGKAQRNAAKQQARWTRQQVRLQRRMMRPRSLVGPVMLLVVGILFLLVQMGKLSWDGLGNWYALWWPMVLVFAGVLLLMEWAFDQRTNAAGQNAVGQIRGRTVGG
ncbi:MAG: hypothetical protein ABI142_08980, partial [Bryocella sp.]